VLLHNECFLNPGALFRRLFHKRGAWKSRFTSQMPLPRPFPEKFSCGMAKPRPNRPLGSRKGVHRTNHACKGWVLEHPGNDQSGKFCIWTIYVYTVENPPPDNSGQIMQINSPPWLRGQAHMDPSSFHLYFHYLGTG
jgi:hypothetical protein